LLKLHQHFFRSFIFIFFSILVGTGISSYFWIKSIYLEQSEKNLSQNIDVISSSLSNLNNISSVVKQIKQKTALRITIISQDGIVLEDSDKNKNEMENHKNRVEILQAKSTSIGKSIRFSNTIKKDLLYVAKKININDKTIYIRMSDYIEVLEDKFLKLSFQITAIFALFFLIALLISYKISKKIKDETQNVLTFLRSITKKNYKVHVSSSYSQEFHDMTNLLNEVAATLLKRERQKEKHTAKLKLANRQKDEIISAISHEFKNPIAIISGYAETILSDKDLPDSMKEKFLQKIYSNSNKMSQIIDRLRLTIKLEEGNHENIYKKCSLEKITQELISDLQSKYKNREIIVKGSDTIIDIDETLFTIALGNLIENALKYSEDKVIIEINTNNIKVIDKGIGISTKELEKITNKYYRVSKNDWNNSLGLGLFIVQSILTLHKFKLEIQSDTNMGTVFAIKF
jgi:signal transduction histidine kinase